jgi:hypothetical protein
MGTQMWRVDRKTVGVSTISYSIVGTTITRIRTIIRAETGMIAITMAMVQTEGMIKGCMRLEIILNKLTMRLLNCNIIQPSSHCSPN